MKKYCLLLFLALNVIINIQFVYAKESNIVEQSDNWIKVDNMYVIPIQIKNNTGIMGMKVELSCDSSTFVSVESVYKGDIITNGMFSDNCSLKKDTISIMWSGVKQIINDGTLFYIYLEKNSSQKVCLNMTYSKEDTFDENWKEVKLNTKKIVLDNNSNKNNKRENEKIVKKIVRKELEQYKKSEKYKRGIANFEDKKIEKKDIVNEIASECDIKIIKKISKHYPNILWKEVKADFQHKSSTKTNLIKDRRNIIIVIITITLIIVGVYKKRRR